MSDPVRHLKGELLAAAERQQGQTVLAPSRRRWLERFRAVPGRHRRLVVAFAAAAFVAAGTASAFGTVRDFVRDVGFGSEGMRPAGARLAVVESGVRFSFRVPTAGWERFKSIPTKTSPAGPISLNKSIVGPQGAEAIIYWTSFPNGDYADACDRLLAPSIGRSAANLAAAVSRAPGTKLVKGPSSVSLGGLPATHVVLTVRKNVGCDPGFFYTWREVAGGALWQTTNVGDTIRVWIVAVGGTRLFIAAATTEDANSRLKREVKRVVESIRWCCD